MADNDLLRDEVLNDRIKAVQEFLDPSTIMLRNRYRGRY